MLKELKGSDYSTNNKCQQQMERVCPRRESLFIMIIQANTNWLAYTDLWDDNTMCQAHIHLYLLTIPKSACARRLKSNTYIDIYHSMLDKVSCTYFNILEI